MVVGVPFRRQFVGSLEQGIELVEESLNGGRNVLASAIRVVVRKHRDMEIHVVLLFTEKSAKLWQKERVQSGLIIPFELNETTLVEELHA